jgi:hypothetical protein
MARDRSADRAGSNNANNQNHNVCALAAARFFRCDDVRYLHTDRDILRAIGKRFSVRSAKSFAKSRTVGGARKNLAAYAERTGAVAFVVMVAGHVLVLRADGTTAVDTAPRKADRRAIQLCHAVYRK